MRRVIGIDIHRTFGEVVIWENGLTRHEGRVDMTRTALEGFARQLRETDEVVIEATGNCMAVSRVLSAPPARHSGILQADAYAGFNPLYEQRADGSSQFREAACWAHLRRDFHDVWETTKSEIAREALDRIGKIYDVEREIAGQSAELRQAARQQHSGPMVAAFKTWAEAQLLRIPGKSDLAKAIRYGLSRWPSFELFLEDGRVGIDNNPAERAMRPIGIGRKNWLFAGSDSGGETLARAMTLIETAKMNGLDPQAWRADILDRIHDHKINRLDELLPWLWQAKRQPSSEAA